MAKIAGALSRGDRGRRGRSGESQRAGGGPLIFKLFFSISRFLRIKIGKLGNFNWAKEQAEINKQGNFNRHTLILVGFGFTWP